MNNFQTKVFEPDQQEVILKNRNNLTITGVKKLESLNVYEFVIETNLGKMNVRGNNLEMIALDIDKGTISIAGKVDIIEYNNKTTVKKKGFVQKLFK